MTAARTTAPRRRSRSIVILTTVLSLLLVGSVVAPGSSSSSESAVALESAAVGEPVKAADLSQFRAGSIITDAVFFNKSTMTAAQIQSFLQAKVPACQAGYTCLKDWYDTSRTTTADPMCAPYSGGIRERASTIIYKVAQACGINPQVLVVMLQKEQRLVTHTWPSDWRYTIAMGQGCPDTAACDTQYYGFFNQVYGAARQLKRYANPPGTSQYFTWYAPGNTWNVRWSPNAACGSGPVFIQNQATANLYYYTPYQPNAAALRAGYGEGDGCSAYGNRNFYQYFTDWFGSTQGVDGRAKIATAYNDSGGGSGPLGGQLATRACAVGATSCWQDYERGAIGWTADVGAFLVTGAMWTAYRAAGGPAGAWGYPTSSQNPITSPTGNGFGQNFERVQGLSSANGLFAVPVSTLVSYAALGWVRGELGWPTSAEICRSGACAQSTQGGWLGHVGATAYTVTGDYAARYRAAGGMGGTWGLPTSGLTALASPQGDGSGQNFQNVQLLTSASGTFGVPMAIVAVHASEGWVRGALGWPTEAASCASGACSQAFQGGYVAGSGGALFAVLGAVATAYRTSGGPGGSWGYPTSAQSRISGPNGDGDGQNFQQVQALSSARGAFAVPVPILPGYAANGWVRGALGWPVAAAACNDERCTQTFQSGVLVRTGGTTWAVSGAIGAAYVKAKGTTGPWGLPTSSESSIAGAATPGSGQNFENVQVLRSSAGVFPVPLALLKAYSAAGWVRGPLGWPMAVAACATAATCTQDFLHGVIIARDTGTFAVSGPIADAYRTAGGVNGPWGPPLSAENAVSSPHGSGSGQNFRNVQVLRSAAGTFAVPMITLPLYSASGWVRGQLGWPTSTSTCDSSGSCVQSFQFGRIVVPTGGPPRIELASG